MNFFELIKSKFQEFRSTFVELKEVLKRVDKLSKQIEMDQRKWDQLKDEAEKKA